MKLIGAVLLIVPFVAMFGMTVAEHGWREAAITWVGGLALAASIRVGMYLLYR